MHHTFKGIYVKSGNSFDSLASAEMQGITFENVTMDSPEQVPAKALPQQPGAPLPADFQPGPGPPPLPPVTVNNMYLPVDAYTGVKASLSSYSL